MSELRVFTDRTPRMRRRLHIRGMAICVVVVGAMFAPGVARAGYGVSPSSESTGTSPTFTVFLGSNDSGATVYVSTSTAMGLYDIPTQDLGSCDPAGFAFTITAGTYTCQPTLYTNSPNFSSTLPPGTYYWWLTFFETGKSQIQISGPLQFTVSQPVAPTGISLTSPADGTTVSPSVALTGHFPAGTNYSIDVSDLNSRNADGSAVLPAFACKGTAASDSNYSCAATSSTPLLAGLTYYWWVVVTTAAGNTFVFGPRSFTVSSSSSTAPPTSTTSTPAPTSSVWVTTRLSAAVDLEGRFINIENVSCSPDTSSSSRLIGSVLYWQRFLCDGETYGDTSFELTYKATGSCSTCWTISGLSGVSIGALQVKTTPPPTKTTTKATVTTSSTSGGSDETAEELFPLVAPGLLKVASSCRSGHYLGSAFLVGPQTIITDLHVLRDTDGSACNSTVRQEGTSRTARVTNWTYWAADDLAVAHLSQPITGYYFTLAPVAPSVGSKISGLGYSLGNALSFNQGTVLGHLQARGVPFLGLNLLGAHGSSGGPILNQKGRVVGVTDIGIANNAGSTTGINKSWIISINLAAFAHGGRGMCSGAAKQSPNTLCGSLR